MYRVRIPQKGLLVLQIVHFLFNMPVVYRPHPLFYHADATAHTPAQYWKGSSGHKTALPQSVRYSGYRARGVCALQSSSLDIAIVKYMIPLPFTE